MSIRVRNRDNRWWANISRIPNGTRGRKIASNKEGCDVHTSCEREEREENGRKSQKTMQSDSSTGIGELGERRKFVGRENGKYIAAEDAIGFNEREEIPMELKHKERRNFRGSAFRKRKRPNIGVKRRLKTALQVAHLSVKDLIW
ncbi:hypothetical protein PRIPAC_73531 [Pristionchus pacificus]|uniref:Uncharacterized protein n=1 Tax=Pristionchus pacificus TaxID=54126 RepID=A0A2A6C5H2_PRIPA|nr:hypothetical protein PRIPAC_73531 [Pristionchus pacificus]|eukprot:PDM73389.1 hypothetical protein PRIPAC_40745 [Pristionchus pacificus]